MTTPKSVRLLDVEPDLGRYLTPGDLEGLGGLEVPVLNIATGELDLHALLAEHHAFGMVVLEGILIRRLTIGEAAALRLVGPGDVLGDSFGPRSRLVAGHGWRASAPSRVAMLDREVLLAAHRAPRLVAGLHARSIDQADRVAVQLAICQLPRVEDRVLSLLWLLAESWGQVTAHGTALRIHLTHETIGGLVGARRSTVTLALGQLTESGAVLRQERGWLLLEAPAGGESEATVDPGPELLAPLPERIAAPVPVVPDVAERVAALRMIREDLASMRDWNQQRVERELTRLNESRRVSRELRERASANRRSFARLHHDDDARDRIRTSEREADDAAAKWLATPVDSVDD